MENNIQLDQIIYLFEKQNIINTSWTYQSDMPFPVRMRYETYKHNKIINKYMYIKDWDIFHKIYKIINYKDRHFYEMIGNKCKFFIDIDGKDIQIDDWIFYIDTIEKELINFFRNELGIEIKTIKCESKETENEKKKSCHIIIPEYCFLIEDCKYLCEKFINVHIKNKKIKDIIDLSVYGKNRCLRIPLSSKIGSKRIKLVDDRYYNESFISDVKNTRFINCLNNKIIIKNSTNLNLKNNNGKDGKNNYNKLYNNYNIYLNIINNEIDKNKKSLKIRNNDIKGNMIICDRIHPSFCQKCNRIHEKENPFLIVDESKRKIYFYCRRNKNPSIYNIQSYIIDNNKIETKIKFNFDDLFRIYQNNILYKNKKVNNIILLKFKNTIILMSPFLNILLNINDYNMGSNNFYKSIKPKIANKFSIFIHLDEIRYLISKH